MKKLVLLLVVISFAVCGCANPYVMKLNNGTQITTASKPKLKGGNYYFKDATGNVNSIPGSRVRVIEPASMAKEDNGVFKPTVK